LVVRVHHNVLELQGRGGARVMMMGTGAGSSVEVLDERRWSLPCHLVAGFRGLKSKRW
jgi:hypothetical protein